MSEARDGSPKPPASKLKAEDLTGESAERNSSQSTGLRRDRNIAEISGEMIDVVGEATGEFPRAASDDGAGESTGRLSSASLNCSHESLRERTRGLFRWA